MLAMIGMALMGSINKWSSKQSYGCSNGREGFREFLSKNKTGKRTKKKR